MRKSVAGQHHHHHHHKREVAQAQVHPVPGAQVLELQEYVVVGDSGDLEASAPRSPPLKLTARTRDANPTARRRKVSDETKEEIEEEDEATLRELLVRYVTCLVPRPCTPPLVSGPCENVPYFWSVCMHICVHEHAVFSQLMTYWISRFFHLACQHVAG